MYDAVQAAGNVLPYADMEGVNMAEPVEDAMRVYIPLNPERTTPAAAGLVNINHASGTELETLPGIGAKTADKIIEYRNEHGGFRSKEELKEVPTIGEGSTPKCQRADYLMKRKYIFLWCASFLAAGIFLRLFLSFLFGEDSFIFVFDGYPFREGFRENRCCVGMRRSFLCAAGAIRMEIAEEIWRQQSQYIVGSEGTFCGIVAEEPLVDKGEDGYARYLIDLRKIRYADGEEKSISGTVYLYDFAVENKYPVGTALEAEGKLRLSVYIRIRGKSIWRSATKAGIF